MRRLRGILRDVLPLLPSGARGYLIFFATASALLTILDTAAVALLALVLQPLMATPAGQDPSMVLPVLHTRVSGGGVSAMLGLAAVLTIVKAALIVWLQYDATRHFERYELESGQRLFTAYIRSPWTERLKRSSAEVAQLGDVGIANMISGVLLPAAQIPTEVITILSIVAVLFVQDPLTASLTIAYLGAMAVVLFVWIGQKARVAGRVNREAAMTMMRLMTEMVSALKEITLRDKSGEVGREIQGVRRQVARSRANIRFLQAVPKFAVDIALVGGLVLIGGVSWWHSGMHGAMTSIALFGVAGFKIIPSIMRFQNYATTIDSSAPYADAVIADIRAAAGYLHEYEAMGHDPLPTDPRTLHIQGVSFEYPGAERPAVQDIDLTVPLGSSLALVGGSGAGKSTLVDLVLGLLTPTSGTIDIDDRDLGDVVHAWRSRVGYVPQEVTLFDGTIAQNVALTWSDDVDDDRVREALRRAQLLDIVESRPGGIHGRVGERGLTLSGGQRQRLGIARALYVEPLVLVLDEATSALDTATEEAVSQAIRQMHGEVTVVAVAHRLSTIRHSDQVCFMADGTIAARGTFDEVVAQSPAFAEQARLAGLA